MNDQTFDNRGFSLVRSALTVAAVMLFMIVMLPIFAVAGPIGGPILTVVVVAVALWYRSRRHGRTLERLPTTDIARLASGYAEISGAAERADERELRDPIQHQPCVWFGVETLRLEKTKLTIWLPFKRAASSRAFVVRDETGLCLVDPRGAQLALNDCVEVTVNERVKHRIWRIRAGDTLTVVGQAGQSADGWRMRRPSGMRTYLIAGSSLQ